ncbi:Plug domain-containing protein [Flavobacterium sp. N502536]|uniref:Plug domain-containing protein n=1 Tax=Flavobacterium sp. N502536 TaxID=2986837 RepID=UPI002221A901|nr:Plug domain-containing protein [Flavobacterium sp. N502536]
MKNIKRISLAFSLFLCFISHAQEKTISDIKPANANNRIIICAPSKRSLMNAPLVIIDGVITNSEQFSKVNPNDIKEIKIVKETEATSLYGDKGKNGAIIITTKENN